MAKKRTWAQIEADTNNYRNITVSDAALFGQAMTLRPKNIRTESEAAGDPRVDWELLESTRSMDDNLYADEEPDQ